MRDLSNAPLSDDEQRILKTLIVDMMTELSEMDIVVSFVPHRFSNPPLMLPSVHPHTAQTKPGFISYKAEFSEDHPGGTIRPALICVPWCDDKSSPVDLLHATYILAHERGHAMTVDKVKRDPKTGYLDNEDNEHRAITSSIEYIDTYLPVDLAQKVLERAHGEYCKSLFPYGSMGLLYQRVQQGAQMS
jgi:hypothetical protein